MHNHDISTQSSSNESYANTDFSQYSIESNSNESRNNSYNPHRSHQKRLILTLSLTSIVFFAEVVGSFLTNSLSLLIDAGHMLTDISVLVASTLTAILMQRRPNRKRTWGWARLEVITAAAGALVLLFVGVYALVEACMRLFGNGHSGIHDVNQLLFFGLLGLIANVGSIIILVSRSNDNMNMRAAFLEVMNDALGSVAVVISAVVMMSTNWSGFDALAGGIIAILMIPRAIKLLKNAIKVLLEQTPEGLDLDLVRKHLESVEHVIAVHDLHASTVSTGMPIFMAHVVVDRDLNMDQCAQILSQLQDCLREHFPVSVSHTTFQLEPEGYTTPSSSEHHE
ncbi:cation transporter [Gardnerella sp. DNF00502]|uniref:cation diffusion facilitator family transporter n=1 Tax=unclassified Gardnerella TaxID=2628112 RepID=UPI000C9FAF7B|nr:cation diffusion facilitator family transporter [Gardnerella sp. KA00735]PNP89923.1 cation diffusion facilitator family transporter [Gardnerella sp. KA00735]